MQCARRLHAMVTASDNAVLYVVGGIGVHHSFHQQTQIPVERYDIAADQWTVLASTTLAGRLTFIDDCFDLACHSVIAES